MNKLITLLFTSIIAVSGFSQGAKSKDFHLKNALVVGQMDNPEDRYSIEINLTEMLVSNGVKAMPSLNVMKMGGDAMILSSDSISQLLKAKGIETYVLVTVRGYDRKFKISEKQGDLKAALSTAGLFDLYRMDIVSISFEFKFFQNGEYVFGDMVKMGNISDRETVLKKFRNKVGKRIAKKWK